MAGYTVRNSAGNNKLIQFGGFRGLCVESGQQVQERSFKLQNRAKLVRSFAEFIRSICSFFHCGKIARLSGQNVGLAPGSHENIVRADADTQHCVIGAVIPNMIELERSPFVL